MRRNEVAKLAGVRPDQVTRIEVEAAREWGSRLNWVPADVLAVVTQEPATYWLTSTNRVYLDDPAFGDPIALDALAYHPDLGLCSKVTLARYLADDPHARGELRTEWERRGSKTGE